MRLFKKISYDRFFSLEEKDVFMQSLDSILKEKKNNKLSKIDVKEFSFYIRWNAYEYYFLFNFRI